MGQIGPAAVGSRGRRRARARRRRGRPRWRPPRALRGRRLHRSGARPPGASPRPGPWRARCPRARGAAWAPSRRGMRVLVDGARARAQRTRRPPFNPTGSRTPLESRAEAAKRTGFESMPLTPEARGMQAPGARPGESDEFSRDCTGAARAAGAATDADRDCAWENR